MPAGIVSSIVADFDRQMAGLHLKEPGCISDGGVGIRELEDRRADNAGTQQQVHTVLRGRDVKIHALPVHWPFKVGDI